MTNSFSCGVQCANTNKVNKMPGVRCPNCAAKGQEVWVIPGKSCHICHTPCA
ncbi:hypothetical protein N7456_000725 [Penicillium angulare]|uniref:Uncharacterized protein n=1 Tax=Penicillium angulare TaxID=116970 RepID=A0A9W9GD31_9EURO|nr:hypothetical protein N7456_000725 [Penicillium angulare]